MLKNEINSALPTVNSVILPQSNIHAKISILVAQQAFKKTCSKTLTLCDGRTKSYGGIKIAINFHLETEIFHLCRQEDDFDFEYDESLIKQQING